MDLTMYIKLLEAPCIIEGFVQGENDCNYEIYLLELLNHSKWFLKRYPDGFNKPNSESNGECDAINKDYQIDFKLLASTTALQARSVFSPQIYKDESNVVFCKGCRNPNRKIKATRLHAAFRGKSLNDLYEILKEKDKAYGIKHDIMVALKMIETPKNLLLFFPYEFYFKKKHEDADAIENIRTALKEDFQIAFEYRNKKTEGKYDTFLTCVYNNSFLIFSIKEKNVEWIDSVKTTEMKTFAKLCDYNFIL